MKVGIVLNPFEPASWEEHEADDVRDLLMQRFASWPDTARIYDLSGIGDWRRAAAMLDAEAIKRRDVTPSDEAAVERLGRLEGPVLVIVPPADLTTILLTVAAVLVGVLASFLLMPKIPSGGKQESPNNSLSGRTNRPRVKQRIEDIYGTVESTPSQITVPYSVFENNKEIEYSYMCAGRGSYAIGRVRDGATNIASISGASAAFYGPYTSPNSGDAPQLQIGAAITDTIRSVIRLNDVNGQTLKPSNLNRVQGDDSIRFVYPDTIETNDSSVDFTQFFSATDAIEVARAAFDDDSSVQTTTASARFTLAGEVEFETLDPSTVYSAGQSLTITNGGFSGSDGLGGVVYTDVTGTYPILSVSSTKVTLDDPAGINADWSRLTQYPSDRTEYHSVTFTVPVATTGLNLNGSYTAAAVTNTTIVLNSPNLVNAAWDNIDDLPGDATAYTSASISRTSEVLIGPFIVDLAGVTEVQANFVALQNLYTLSKKGKQSPLFVTIELEVTEVDSADVPIGAPQVASTTMVGSSTERSSLGTTLRFEPSSPGRFSITARRTSPTPDDQDYGGVSDEVKWKDCYGFAPIEQTDFGDVTTVHTRTVATPGALANKERRFNARLTRKLPQRISGSTFGAPAATNSIADILAAISLDPFIGRRTAAEIDYDNLYDTAAAVAEYFGTTEAAEFGHTFDDDNISYQDTAQTVAQTAFCQAYRVGRLLRLAFERATEESSLIFNARNIMPRSQKRKWLFGISGDHDGIELAYSDPLDAAPLTYSIPEDGSARSAEKVDIVGIRSRYLAYWHAWRAWNKARYQTLLAEFEATQEAVLTLPKDRILVTDRTRPEYLQGEVDEEDGTTLTLSHAAVLDPDTDYTIFLQHIDGTVEALGVVAGVDDFHVEISAAPRMPLAIDPAIALGNAKYIIAPDVDVRTRAFIVAERETSGDLTETIRAINYTFLYYQHDQLVLWLPTGVYAFEDHGPYRTDGDPTGSVGMIADSDRNDVIAAGGGSLTFSGFTARVSYTKAVWLKVDALAGTQVILNSEDGTELFQLVGSNLVAQHGATAISAAWPADGEWHYAAVTYDDDSDDAVLYVDGVEAATGDLPGRTVDTQIACTNLVGRVDDLRVWRRALTAREIHAVYLSTLDGSKPVPLLALSGDQILTDDEGHGFILE